MCSTHTSKEKMWSVLEGPKVWAAHIDNEGNLIIPPDLLTRLDWHEGDTLHIDTSETGCIILSKS